MQEIESELRKLKQTIDDAKEERANVLGRKAEQMKRLKAESGCKDILGGKKFLKKLRKDCDDLKGEIQMGYKGLSERYEW